MLCGFSMTAGDQCPGRPCARPLVFLFLLAVSIVAARATPTEDLLAAAAAGDVAALELALIEKADVAATDSEGRSALMLAVENNHYGAARILLWNGASVRQKSADGRDAFAFLKSGEKRFAEFFLLLRCYRYCQEFGKPVNAVRNPELVIISEPFVDFGHPSIASHYAVSERERDGKPGVDDDRNGFVDDVYGWNLLQDKPVVKPGLLGLSEASGAEVTKALFAQYRKAGELKDNGNDAAADKIYERLQNSYTNPIVAQVGAELFMGAKIDLNDWAYCEMIEKASHGSHVAGIVIASSGGQARVLCATHGAQTVDADGVDLSNEKLIAMAEKEPTFDSFARAVITASRESGKKKGLRASEFLQASGASVANMSWGLVYRAFERQAEGLKEIYSEHGANPSSVASGYRGDQSVGALSDLALELLAARSAYFALTFYNNPNVLFVIAAGNEGEDNDAQISSPQGFSRIFPNILIVASTGSNGKLSAFSNYGRGSVQIAAPGENIRSAYAGGLEGDMSGTSMASPNVAGTAAAMRKAHPNLSAREIARVLLTSVDRKPYLRDKVTSGGIINLQRSQSLADGWTPLSGVGISAALDASESEGGSSGATLVRTDPPPTGNATKVSAGLPFTALGGFPGSWAFVRSGVKEPSPQRLITSKEWPKDAIQAAVNDGYSLTAVAGDGGGWAVLMDKDRNVESQKLVGFAFDHTAIAEFMKEGYRIVSIGGYGTSWVTLMNPSTGWSEQRYTFPTPLSDGRKDWIMKRWKEGFRITSVAGDDDPAKDTDGWVFVMTKDTTLSQQVYFGPGEWPDDDIATRTKDGYRITCIAGYDNRWVVIMSTNTSLGPQETSHARQLPENKVEQTVP